MKTTLVTLLALSSSPELSFMKVHDCMIENAILINNVRVYSTNSYHLTIDQNATQTLFQEGYLYTMKPQDTGFDVYKVNDTRLELQEKDVTPLYVYPAGLMKECDL